MPAHPSTQGGGEKKKYIRDACRKRGREIKKLMLEIVE
jgi:hypothetical protein